MEDGSPQGACTIMLRPRYDGDEKTDWSKCEWQPGKIPIKTKVGDKELILIMGGYKL